MSALRRILLALTVLAALLSTGCLKALEVAGASLQLTGAVIDLAAAASSGGSGHRSELPRNGSDGCCYRRENPTPVDQPVDRPMSECELERGRYRETHQDEDEIPPQLRCLADGSYPKVSLPPAAAPAEPPPPAEAEACEPAAPIPPADSTSDTI